MSLIARFIRKNKVSLLFIIILITLIYLTNKVETYRGGLENSIFNFLKFEFILISVISLSVLKILKKRIVSYIFIASTVVLLYIFYNEFYIYFNRLPKISDLNQIPELFQVLSWTTTFIVIGGVLIYLVIFLKLIEIKYSQSISLILISTILFLSIKIYPVIYVWSFKVLGFKEIPYNKIMSARESGYFNFTLYEEAKKNMALNSLEQKDNFEEKSLNLTVKENLKNIHLIVLESFYDPNSFENLSFSENPIHPEFIRFNKKQNISISPVYGGNTAQAEFEILTGAPAFSKYGSIEFNLFSGNKINRALPNLLRDVGYLTIATNALKPDIFNSYNAYRSLGFDEQYYITGNTYLKKGKEWFISDGDLLDQNFKFIDSIIHANPSKPIFNYVLGMYGHAPFSMNISKTPLKINVYLNKEPVSDDRIIRSVNQIYYRTQALANYIRKLNIIDPESIILITADHLPSLAGIEKFGNQARDIRKVPFYLIKSGEAQDLGNGLYHHYNFTELLLKSVFKEENIFKLGREERYDQIIYQSIQ